ncbi:BspA family leucine-rich repeat surface protein [Peredibacter starrii]|uniref:BspA family leucine-rich repeat surface protein n=1 Tax=Peredibacter starrii TaxID=28202 RepID=A0AAX4HSN0_9BACT|nr:BspA family leucine-rich repeat surface protein [Peredibacter starrii]WPU66188.1 BspA family leucine-rich repeat surface protein [Peredibacter starrii]
MLRFLLFISILLTTTGCNNHIKASFDNFTNNGPVSVGAPSIANISDKIVYEGRSITIDVNDNSTNGDVDGDGNPITYTCFYDMTVDAAVANTNDCTLIPGLSFNTSTGVLTWTPNGSQSGNYEIKITATAESTTDEEIFKLEVKPPLPFTSRWETTGPNETITLPLRAGYNYNMVVDWGDGTPTSTITSDADPDKTHNYVNAGIYTVVITGLAEAWFFDYDSSSSNIIEVVELGGLGWKNLENAFAGCDNLVSFAGGDTSEVTNMSSMFSFNTNLTHVDLSSFDTAAVTDMSEMFSETHQLTSLDVSNFNTAAVTDMDYMFNYNAATSLDLSNFNTSAVTSMHGMFWGSSVSSLDLSSFNTSNVTSMNSMFRLTSNLATLNLSSFNTSSVTDMISMFQSATSLTTLNLSHFNTSNIEWMDGMFVGTTNLTSINATNWDVSAVTSYTFIWNASNPGLQVICDQGGSPGTGDLFSKPCN